MHLQTPNIIQQGNEDPVSFQRSLLKSHCLQSDLLQNAVLATLKRTSWSTTLSIVLSIRLYTFFARSISCYQLYAFFFIFLRKV